MRMWRAVALGAVLVTGASRDMVTFRVVDEVDPREISEEVTLRINGTVVGRFRLEAGRPQQEVEVRLPEAAGYAYALCGQIVLRGADGAPETRVVDDAGRLEAVDGKRFEMLAAGDFTRFYLREGRDGAGPEGARGQGCPRDVAMRGGGVG
jgi:hypothetical protein